MDAAPAAWSGFIQPVTILEQVRNTAPFLAIPEANGVRPIHGGDAPLGFMAILGAGAALESAEDLSPDEQLEDYFALCLAAHYATAATYVPTDVDTKIRGLLWRQTRHRETLRRMGELALQARRWDLSGVSRRTVSVDGFGPVSGHDGEWLSIIAGALGRFVATGDEEYAETAAVAIDAELRREASAFRVALLKPGLEVDTLKLAASITHNLGDLDQGISFWDSRAGLGPYRERFGRLAHENTAAYDGMFQVIARLYKENLAAEGHRHYPLRSVKPLRRSAELLLPLGPFLDQWGAIIATHSALTIENRAEVLDALVRGCRKVPNQSGYYRAIAGFQAASSGTFERAVALLPNSSRKDLREPGLRQRIAVPVRSFESALIKKVAQVRTHFRQ